MTRITEGQHWTTHIQKKDPTNTTNAEKGHEQEQIWIFQRAYEIQKRQTKTQKQTEIGQKGTNKDKKGQTHTKSNLHTRNITNDRGKHVQQKERST